MENWDTHLSKVIESLDQKILKTRRAKSVIGFTKKYLASINKNLANTCVTSISLASSSALAPLEIRTDVILGVLDILPFIVYTVDEVTVGLGAENRLARLCFLLTKALLTHENIFDNSLGLINEDFGFFSGDTIRQAYLDYRKDPRTRQIEVQRIVAAVNSALGAEAILHSEGDKLEGWCARYELWGYPHNLSAVMWCLALACNSTGTVRREGFFMYLNHLWAVRTENQKNRKNYTPDRLANFVPISGSNTYQALEDYEEDYVKIL